MSKPVFTDEKWFVLGNDAHSGDIPYIDVSVETTNGSTSVAAVCCDLVNDDFKLTPECWERAHLIASAPALYEALEVLGKLAEAVFEKYETRLGDVRETYQDKPDNDSLWGFNDATITYGDLRKARAALAAARGET